MEGPLSAKVPSARDTHADELNSDYSRSRISALKCNSFFFVCYRSTSSFSVQYTVF
jgi:hypothetical protein